LHNASTAAVISASVALSFSLSSSSFIANLQTSHPISWGLTTFDSVGQRPNSAQISLGWTSFINNSMIILPYLSTIASHFLAYLEGRWWHNFLTASSIFSFDFSFSTIPCKYPMAYVHILHSMIFVTACFFPITSTAFLDWMALAHSPICLHAASGSPISDKMYFKSVGTYCLTRAEHSGCRACGAYWQRAPRPTEICCWILGSFKMFSTYVILCLQTSQASPDVFPNALAISDANFLLKIIICSRVASHSLNFWQAAVGSPSSSSSNLMICGMYCLNIPTSILHSSL